MNKFSFDFLTRWDCMVSGAECHLNSEQMMYSGDTIRDRDKEFTRHRLRVMRKRGHAAVRVDVFPRYVDEKRTLAGAFPQKSSLRKTAHHRVTKLRSTIVSTFKRKTLDVAAPAPTWRHDLVIDVDLSNDGKNAADNLINPDLRPSMTTVYEDLREVSHAPV